jgi:predicted enzyme related to lactoylglutathione lyase
MIHFEIQADDPQRAVGFYEKVLGWTVTHWGDQPYWLCKTGPDDQPGIHGAIMPRQHPQPVIGTFDVADLTTAIAAVKAAGGELLHGPNEIPGVGSFAYCKDTEGNWFGLMQALPRS